MNIGGVYIPVSVMMFREYAVWGAWAPVLAARLFLPATPPVGSANPKRLPTS